MKSIVGLIMSLISLIMGFLFMTQKNKDNFQNGGAMLNIYNEPLKECSSNPNDSGSWDSEGKCSEIGGGVHQICVENIASKTKNFSKSTGQSNWSDQRGNSNHCVCLGAWSLYNSKNKNKKNNILKCDAIPKIALSNKYISNFSEGWSKWNGYELDNQIKNGVESLINNCYKNDSKSENLKKNYCNFAKNNRELNKSKLFKKLCY